MFANISTFYFATLVYAFISFKLSGWWEYEAENKTTFVENCLQIYIDISHVSFRWELRSAELRD